MPLFNGLKLYDSDMVLLKNIMNKTGAKTISEILNANTAGSLTRSAKKWRVCIKEETVDISFNE